MNRLYQPALDRLLWVKLFALFAVAVALRWFRLDLMHFRYDQAAVAFRAAGAFEGAFPWTGIVNSLGFANAPGYVWSVLPAFVVSKDPLMATGWHGLLSATMVFPLVWLGRRFRADALGWLPAVLAATLPISVLAGRNLWAQYLLLPLVAWTLYFLDSALRNDRAVGIRLRDVAICMGLLAWGISVHFSVALIAGLAALALAMNLRGHWKGLGKALIPAMIIGVTMIPSIADWARQLRSPASKPDFVLAYEAQMPGDGLPWWARLQQTLQDVLLPRTLDSVAGVKELLSDGELTFVTGYDVLIWVLLIAGVGCCLWRLVQGRREGRQEEEGAGGARVGGPPLSMILLLVPMVAGALLLSRVNGGYFIGSWPVLWLMVLWLPLGGRAGRWLGVGIVCAVGLGGAVTTGIALRAIDRADAVPGNYYYPYRHQVKVARYLADEGVRAGTTYHLGGDWYQHSYSYLQQYVAPKAEGEEADRYALMEDRLLTAGRLGKAVFGERGPVMVDQVGVLLFDSRGEMEIFRREYYEAAP